MLKTRRYGGQELLCAAPNLEVCTTNRIRHKAAILIIPTIKRHQTRRYCSRCPASPTLNVLENTVVTPTTCQMYFLFRTLDRLSECSEKMV